MSRCDYRLLVAGHGGLQSGACGAAPILAHHCISGLGVVTPVSKIYVEDDE